MLLIAQALVHAKEKHGHSGKREVDADGKSPCLWDDCPSKLSVKSTLANLRAHEALHVKGTRLRQAFVCPHPGCVEAFGKDADKAWEHAWKAHGIPLDPKRCLWAACQKDDLRFTYPSYYKEHEAAHTGIFPFSCSCGYSCLKKTSLTAHRGKCLTHQATLPPKISSSGN